MKPWTLVTLTLAAAACLVWIAVRQMPDGRLHVVFLDVASGQGVVVRTPSGRSVVIDGGPQASALLAALGRYLPFWQRTLHAVIATHQGTSAVQAMSDACLRYMPLLALGPVAGPNQTLAYRQWQDTLGRRGVSFTVAETGTLLDLGDGVAVEIVAVRGGALAVRLSYGDFSLLLPGVEWSNATPLDATVVALPVTGKGLSSIVFKDSVNSAILFTGKKTQQPLALPEWPEVTVFATAVHGPLELITDGRGLAVHQIR